MMGINRLKPKNLRLFTIVSVLFGIFYVIGPQSQVYLSCLPYILQEGSQIVKRFYFIIFTLIFIFFFSGGVVRIGHLLKIENIEDLKFYDAIFSDVFQISPIVF